MPYTEDMENLNHLANAEQSLAFAASISDPEVRVSIYLILTEIAELAAELRSKQLTAKPVADAEQTASTVPYKLFR